MQPRDRTLVGNQRHLKCDLNMNQLMLYANYAYNLTNYWSKFVISNFSETKRALHGLTSTKRNQGLVTVYSVLT